MRKTILSIAVAGLLLTGCTSGEDASTNITIDNTQNNQTVENNVTTSIVANTTPTYDIDLWDYLLATSGEKWYDTYTIDSDGITTSTYINSSRVRESKSGDSGLEVLQDATLVKYDRYDDRVEVDNVSFPRHLNFGDNIDNNCKVIEIKDSYSFMGYTYLDALMVLCMYDTSNILKAYKYDVGLVSVYQSKDDGTKLVINKNDN